MRTHGRRVRYHCDMIKSPGSVPAPAPSPSLPWTNAAAVTAAILAALASIGALLSTRHTTEAMIDQIDASNGWSLYQAKSMKLNVLESKMEMMQAMSQPAVPDDAARVTRYKAEQAEIKVDAETNQASGKDHRARAAKFAAGSTAAQIAIALTAISLLIKRPWFWWLSLVGMCVSAGFIVLGSA